VQSQSAPGSATGANTGAQSGNSGSSGGGSMGSDCTTDDFSLRLSKPQGAAGSIYYSLIFTNKSEYTCSMEGYPGVSLLKGDGTRIGSPATRMSDTAKRITLAPGQSANATLHTINQGMNDKPCWASASIVKVYPPNNTAALTTSASDLTVCGGTFEVGPVTAGTNP
jgi:hypothetical protein